MAIKRIVKIGDSLFVCLQSNWARDHEISKGSRVNVRELKNGSLILEVPKLD